MTNTNTECTAAEPINGGKLSTTCVEWAHGYPTMQWPEGWPVAPSQCLALDWPERGDSWAMPWASARTSWEARGADYRSAAFYREPGGDTACE